MRKILISNSDKSKFLSAVVKFGSPSGASYKWVESKDLAYVFNTIDEAYTFEMGAADFIGKEKTEFLYSDDLSPVEQGNDFQQEKMCDGGNAGTDIMKRGGVLTEQQKAEKVMKIAADTQTAVGVRGGIESWPKEKVKEFVEKFLSNLKVNMKLPLSKEVFHELQEANSHSENKVLFFTDSYTGDEKFMQQIEETKVATKQYSPELYDILITYSKQPQQTNAEPAGKAVEKLHKSVPAKLAEYMPFSQASAINEFLRGEEKEFFSEKIDELLGYIDQLPKHYETEKIPFNEKIIYLRYMTGNSNWLIAESDTEQDPAYKHLHDFGFAVLGGDMINAEWGDISIAELKKQPTVELDLHFEPVKFPEALEKCGFSESRLLYNKKKSSRSFDPSTYENQYLFNLSVQEFLDETMDRNPQDFSEEEKIFIALYDGMGGLDKFGAEGKGILFEYYTPEKIIEKMWALAYKFGFEAGMSVLEPAAGIGRFLKHLPVVTDDKNLYLTTGSVDDITKGFPYYVAIEPNKYSARICKILYPFVQVLSEQVFEQQFIMQNKSMRGKIEYMRKYELVITNPPYGNFNSFYGGMGEKEYSGAHNYVDYFIFRGLDILEKGGLLVMIVGAEVASGGKPFLGSGNTKCKEAIAKKGELLDAYRLPNGLFERTDVQSEIIVMRKK